jgi:hypothetical protein
MAAAAATRTPSRKQKKKKKQAGNTYAKLGAQDDDDDDDDVDIDGDNDVDIMNDDDEAVEQKHEETTTTDDDDQMHTIALPPRYPERRQQQDNDDDQYVAVRPPTPTRLQLEAIVAFRRVKRFDTCRYFTQAFNFARHNALRLMVLNCLWLALAILLYMVSTLIQDALLPSDIFKKQSAEHPRYSIWQQLGAVFVQVMLSVLVYGGVYMPCVASFYYAVFEALRANAPLKLSDCWHMFRSLAQWWHFFLLGEIAFAMVFLGLVIFIVPGFFALAIWIWMVPLAVEYGPALGLRQLFSYAAIITTGKRHACDVIGFLVLLVTMQLCGMVFFLVGLFITVPCGLLAIAFAYHHLVGVRGTVLLVPRDKVRLNDLQAADAGQAAGGEPAVAGSVSTTAQLTLAEIAI